MEEFWENYKELIIGALLGGAIKVMYDYLSPSIKKWLDVLPAVLGWGVKHKYYEQITLKRENLKLVGPYADLEKPPKLENVYIALKLNSEGETRPEDWTRIFKKSNKHIAIKGMPGTGKTTLLDYLILIFAGKVNHPLRKELGNLIPVYVRLRQLKKQTLQEFIGSKDFLASKEEIKFDYFEKRLQRGECLVLFDGLDEVLDEKEKEHAIEQINWFAQWYGKNRIVITSRPQGWSKSFFPKFDEYDIQDLSDTDVFKFIQDWYRVVNVSAERKKLPEKASPEQVRLLEEEAREAADQDAKKLYAALEKNHGLFKVARAPLILVLITLVYKHEHRLPQGRAEVYESCLKILLSTWEEGKGIQSPLTAIPYENKWSVLSALAYEFLKRGVIQLKTRELCEIIEPLLAKKNIAVPAPRFIEYIAGRAGILADFGVDEYGFAHRALQDRLAADYVKQKSLSVSLLEHADKPEWREVILITAGLVDEKARAALIDALLTQGDQSAASLAMAGWSLAEGVAVEDEQRQKVTATLAARLNVVESSSDFSLLSNSFSAADPKAMQSWMGTVLSGYNPDLQKRVLSTLIKMKPEEGRPFTHTLTRILADSHAEVNLRAQCALAIASLKPQADSELWRILESAREPKQDVKLKAAATWAYCELGRYEKLGLIKIPAGEFLMGSSDEDRSAEDNEKPQHRLYLPDYYIAKYPVTVKQYREFLQASGHETGDSDSLKGVDDHPVVWVSWKDALKYAQWHGLTLPSESEWEKAASWDDAKKEKRIYPWGNEWRKNYANTEELWNSGLLARLLSRDKKQTTKIGDFSPQGDSPYGCVDMAGNVWEWTRSVRKPYPYDPNDGREDQPDKWTVQRGGSFYWDKKYSRCAFRNDFFDHSNVHGFRVCASPVSPERLLNSDS
jgi:formylglycine-generating enzyme required for sulfatase activity